jgi:hypothetical protein
MTAQLLLTDSILHVVLPALCCAGERDRRVLSALQELVRDCTAFNPDGRPTMKQVLERIRQIQRMFDPRLAAAAAAGPAAAAGAATSAGTACSFRAGSATAGASGAAACKGRPAVPGSAAAGYGSKVWDHGEQDAVVPMLRKKSGVTDPAVAAAIDAANAAVAAHASMGGSMVHPATT